MSNNKALINKLSRQQIVDLLEGVSIACYDSESTETLRRALTVNVNDGTISMSDVEDELYG